MTLATLEGLRGILESTRAAHGVPGAVIGVFHGGRAEVATFGITNVEDPAPVTPATLFEVGSITKTFTATALLVLADQGKLDLDLPVRMYLPRLRLADEAAAQTMTLRHLLTHRSGLEGEWYPDDVKGDHRLEELDILAPPGTTFSYSSPGFVLAGRVLEVVAGRTFTNALRELVLDPLGLSSMCYRADDRFPPPWAAGHLVGEGAPVVARPSEVGRSHPAMGGLCANVQDLLAWARVHLSGAGILKPETFRAMREPVAESFPLRTWIGMPWAIDERGGIRVIGHSGRTWGYVATLELVPACEFALVILTNSYDRVDLMRDLREILFRELAGLQTAEPFTAKVMDNPDPVLEKYAGRFGNRHATFTITPQGNGRLGVLVESRGYPRPDSRREFPPEVWAFSAPDQVFQEDPPSRTGERRAFVRDSEGRVKFLRGMSLYPRL